MNTKSFTRLFILSAIVTAITASAHAQTPEQNINVTIRPSQTVEERVADEIKAKELKEAAEEKSAAERAARIAEKSPKALLSRARLVYVRSDTSFFDSTQLQNALSKREEFTDWQLAIIDWPKGDVTDIVVEVDRPLFTYDFTYKITDRANGIILAIGKVTAFDGNIAAPMLAKKIIQDMKIARGEAKKK